MPRLKHLTVCLDDAANWPAELLEFLPRTTTQLTVHLDFVRRDVQSSLREYALTMGRFSGSLNRALCMGAIAVNRLDWHVKMYSRAVNKNAMLSGLRRLTRALSIQCTMASMCAADPIALMFDKGIVFQPYFDVELVDWSVLGRLGAH